jgi:hypothetical protein
VDYSGNLTQKIDIFNIKVSCADLEVDVCDDSMLTVHEFVIYNNENVKLQVGELEWNGENWGAQSINVSSFPEDLYYVTSYFEHNLGNGSNDHISGDTSEFIVDHILIITPPILEVRDGEERYLNITNITAISSYKLPSDLNLGNVTSFKYSIENYTNHWKPIMLGELNWTGDQWQVTNINLSKYGPGQYRVKLTCYFAYDYYDHTEEFNFTYTGDIEKPDQEESSEEVEIPVYYIIIPIIVIILILMLLYISTKDRKNDR